MGSELSEQLRLFIYQNFDSVELIEVLLYLRTFSSDWKSVEQISREIRTSESSAQSRLETLVALQLIERNHEAKPEYHYAPKSRQLSELVDLLAQEYKIKKHLILEIMFSPAKAAKHFADAFFFGKSERKKGDSDG